MYIKTLNNEIKAVKFETYKAFGIFKLQARIIYFQIWKKGAKIGFNFSTKKSNQIEKIEIRFSVGIPECRGERVGDDLREFEVSGGKTTTALGFVES